MKNYTRNICVLICASLCLCISKKSYSQQSLVSINGWNAYVHLPASYSSGNTSYPTIIFFPGLGEVGTNASAVIGNGPGAYITQGWNGNTTVDGKTVEFIVISLQTPYAYPHEDVMNTEIQTIKSMYRVDPKKLYLTGLSHGGWCSSTFVSGDAYGGPYTYASQVAAVVTVEGVIPDDNSPYPQLFDNYAKSGGKYLGFEQAYDNRDTKTVVNRMNSTVPNSAIYVQTNFGGGGHCCWASFYGGQGTVPTNWLLDGVTQNIYQWMARQTLGGATPPPANVPPVANAGSNQTITLPANSVTLAGTGTDSDGSISSYAWSQVSGPSTATINTPATAITIIKNLVSGVYTFQLKVTDNAGATSTANVTVTVNTAPLANIPPVANVSNNQTITLPVNSVTLTGSGTDADGTVKSYLWSKISGPNGSSFSQASSATTVVNGLIAGVYIFQLKVTDNVGATGVATTQITVNNSQASLPPSGSKNIRVNIYGGSNPSTDSKWNNWNLYAGNTINNMLYEDKTQSTISASISGDRFVIDNGVGYASSSTTPPSAVLRYNSAATSFRTLSFSGLDPSKKYTFEMYASRSGGGNNTLFQLNSQQYIVITGNNVNSYAQFTDISPDSKGTVSVILSSVNVWHYIAGFSIIDQSGGASTSKIAVEAAQTNAIYSIQPDATTEKTISRLPEAYVYPNPFVSSFQVQIKDEAAGAYRLILSDIFGKQILVKKVNKGAGPSIEHIQVNNLASGNYLLQVINENGSKNVYKIIKQ
ncbi:MAG: T9SS type A sorting domain-containing protein [Ferruginibacter sp.]